MSHVCPTDLSDRLSPMSLGEALFDLMPSGSVLGGAPLNTCVHMHQLLGERAGNVAMATAVGNDDLGQSVKDQLAKRGIDTSLIQTDADHPTGQVHVTFGDDGDPIYDIQDNVAWDHIQRTESLLAAAAQADAMCFGSLAQRNETSRQAIQGALAAGTQALRLYDVNLRPGLSPKALLAPSFELATVAKLGQDELHTVNGLLGLPQRSSLEDAVADLTQRFALQTIVVTCGSEGTKLFADDQLFEGKPAEFDPDDNADPVGAGDSVGAAVAVGLLLGWDLEQIATWANAVGAYVAGKHGATPKLPEHLIADAFAATC